MHATALHVMAPGGDRNRKTDRTPARNQKPQAAEDFAYKVELWDEKKQKVEQVVAVAASAAIAHAAFYAAAREFGDRFVTLRHKGNIVNRWNGPTH